MIIALVSNEKWYNHMAVLIYSIIKVTPNVKKFYLFVETENLEKIDYIYKLSKKYKNIEFCVIDAWKLINKNLTNFSKNRNSFFTDFCMVKLMLQDVVKEDKVLYMDIDMIVKRDISNVWKYNISDFYVAGVKDFGIYKRGSDTIRPVIDTYINSGFLLFNIKKIRIDKIKNKMFDLLNNERLDFPDQDALNLICHEKIKFLPSTYNCSEDVTQRVINSDLVKVYHFAGIKKSWVVNRLHAEEWYEEEEEFYNAFGWPKEG